jgi:hypothetical protein
MHQIAASEDYAVGIDGAVILFGFMILEVPTQ